MVTQITYNSHNQVSCPIMSYHFKTITHSTLIRRNYTQPSRKHRSILYGHWPFALVSFRNDRLAWSFQKTICTSRMALCKHSLQPFSQAECWLPLVFSKSTSLAERANKLSTGYDEKKNKVLPSGCWLLPHCVMQLEAAEMGSCQGAALYQPIGCQLSNSQSGASYLSVKSPGSFQNVCSSSQPVVQWPKAAKFKEKLTMHKMLLEKIKIRRKHNQLQNTS